MIRYTIKLNSLGFLPFSNCCLQDKRHIDYPLHIPSQRQNTPRGVVWHMTYFASSSFCFFLIATNKNNQNTVDKTFSITHDTLIQSVDSLFQKNPTFWPIQNKTILTTSGFHDVFGRIFHLITHTPSYHFSLSLIGCPVMMTAFWALSLVTGTHGLL